MLQYLIYVVLFQSMFLVVYDIFHKKDTFFSLGRFYLLLTSILSFILPLIKIHKINESIPEEYLVQLPAVFIGEKTEKITDVIQAVDYNSSLWDNINWWVIIYITGITFFLIRFILKNRTLYRLRKISTLSTYNKFKVYTIPNSTDAFSFWNSIYLGKDIPEQSKNQIITHEFVHLDQKHSLDLIWFEILKIILWFNPLIYLYQNRVNMLHEYIADATSVKALGRKEYYTGLLNSIFDTEDISFINQFYKNSLLKKRIDMLNKNRSKAIAKLKFFSLAPLIIFMLILSSFAIKRNLDQSVESASDQQSTTESRLENVEIQNSTQDQSLNKESQSTERMKDSTEEPAISSTTNHFSFQDSLNFFENQAIQKLLEIKSDIEKGESFAESAILYSKDPGSKSNGGYYKITKDSPFEDSFIEVAFSLSEGQISEPFKTSFGYHIMLLEKINGEEREVRHILIVPKTEMPFATIDTPPSTNECKNLEDRTERKSCFAEAIKKHVSSNFNVDIATPLGLVGINRVYVRFAIDTTGHITDIQARAPHQKLEEEAIRVIQSIPQVIPGEHEGQKVKVLYSIPIVFKVEDKKDEEQDNPYITEENILKMRVDHEKYSELQPGYYLITGVYKNESYLKKDKEIIQKNGLDLKSFKNPVDSYFYAYLDKYDSLYEAKKMLYSDYDNKYSGDLYILKIEGK